MLCDDHDGLDRYAAAVAELVLFLRDEGHLLSSIDQHFIERWFEAGYPLETVLRAVRESGERLKKRKSPPRGLPLRSMRRVVEREGERARQRLVGSHEVAPAQESTPDDDLLSPLLAELAERRGEPLVEASWRAVESLVERRAGPQEVFVGLIAVSREYYQGRVEALSGGRRDSLRAGVLADLGEAASAMEPAALEETVAELVRRRLRDEDPILDPARLWRVR